MKIKKKIISSKSNKLYSFLLLFIGLANMLDAFTTYVYVGFRGVQELNPLMDWLIGVDPNLFLVVKLILGTGGMFLIWKFFAHANKATRIAVWGVSILYFIVTINNIIGIVLMDILK